MHETGGGAEAGRTLAGASLDQGHVLPRRGWFQKRPGGQTPGEELASALSHGLGLALGLAGAPVLVLRAVRQGSAAGIVGASVFAATLVLLYLASLLYHSVPPGRAKRVLRVLDHGAIFLLIAGTYTPFTLGVLRGPWGWSLFGVIWGLAAAGLVFKFVLGVRYRWVSVVLYVAMGWTALVAAQPILARMAPAGIAWLGAGGLFYTAGVVFFAAERLRYHHLVWHLFVLAGTGCHYVAVLLYAG